MEWGGEWGTDDWGGPAPRLVDFVQVALDRYPECTKEQTGLMALTEVLVGRWQTLANFSTDIQPYLLLFIPGASGVFLDSIGNLLNVPRDGRDDPYYRRVLQAYAEIVFPNRRTLPGLLSALETLGGVGNVRYVPAYPMCFTIEVENTILGSQEAQDIQRIIEIGTPAAYCAAVIEEVPTPFRWSDSTNTVTVTNGWWSDANDPQIVTGGDQWSSVTVI